MIKKLFFIIFLLFSTNCFAEIIITDFNQDVEITDFGRKVTIDIKAKIKLESKNYYINGWSYIFSKNQKVEISEAKVVGRKYKSSFGDNQLKFEFEKATNGDTIEVVFKYVEFNDNIQEYSRVDYVMMPEFAKNANGVLNLVIPDNYIVYSTNPSFKRNYNTYTWKGKIPEKGLSDFFYLTFKKAKWKAEVLTEIIGKENFTKMDIKIPLYFKNLNNKIENYNITTNFDDYFANIKEDDKNIVINLNNINSSIAQVKIDTTLEIDLTSNNWMELDTNRYLNIDRTLGLELNNIISRVRQDNKNQEPIYIALAKFVHDYIVYDKSYYGKQMTTKEILKTGNGVCAHYSQLYNDLLRTAGIPSVMVLGMSYDPENKKFESHSWNLVYANGNWVSIDPTLGFYSGILPISHIAFYLDNVDAIKYTVYNSSISDFKSDIKRNISFLGELK
ncbi:MAG TPA: transglutaminase-like domain-containing protein [Rickettsiales bacterium]|nr:transglutaminase-like domain-containing protein [Rickettsiales bacterium]